MSEIQETRKSSKLKFTYILAAIAISCLMIGASMGIIISGTTPTFPTVIEPGSGVSGADFVVFADGGNYYAKNGTTGAVAYSSASAYTLIHYAVDRLGGGGIIAFSSGTFNLGGTDLTIDNTGVILQGSGGYPRTGLSTITTDTRITGNIIVEAENVKIRDLTINGHLTFTSNAGKTSVAHYCQVSNVAVKNGVSFIGLAGSTSWQVPFQISIEDSYIEIAATGNVLSFVNPNELGSIDHITIQNSILDQEYVGDCIHIEGKFSNIAFQNSLIMTYALSNTVNWSQAGTTAPMSSLKFIGCTFEIGVGISTIFTFKAPITGSPPIDIQVIGGWFVAHTMDITLIYTDADNTGIGRSRILFQSVNFADLYNIRMDEVVSIYQTALPSIVPVFSDCKFRVNVTFQQLGTSQSIGIFENCENVNGKGLLSTPVKTESLSLIGTSGTWVASTNYTVGDVPMAVTVTGGTGVSISIYGPNNYLGVGVLIVSSLTTITREYLPQGYKINLGAFSVAPTIVVEGL